MLTELNNLLSAPRRFIQANVLHFRNGEALPPFESTNVLSSFTVERHGEDSKFFGFGVSQKLKVELIDRDRLVQVLPGDELRISITSNDTWITPYTQFFVSEITRDENTNNLTIDAFDKVDELTKHTYAEITTRDYSIKELIDMIVAILGVGIEYRDVEDLTVFDLDYSEGANFEDKDTFRDVLDGIAEATQTIYFFEGGRLIFKRLVVGEPVAAITKDDYITLKEKGSVRLHSICAATELGDNVSVTMPEGTGITQYVRDNQFWELRDDIALLLNKAITAIGGIESTQYECEWKGSYLLEIGDYLSFETKEGKAFNSFVLNDTLKYNGGLHGSLSWQYEPSEESPSNPNNIGEAINQTFAKVDKVNKTIELLASEVSNNSSQLAQIKLDTKGIAARVEATEKLNESNAQQFEELRKQDGLTNTAIDEIKKSVDAKISSEDVKLEINNILKTEGVTSVKTTTGFTFNEDGLNVGKTGTDLTTNISEDGMRISKGDEVVLTASNQGVDAVNLHATTYLEIGKNSRFEDYLTDRTACFFIREGVEI